MQLENFKFILYLSGTAPLTNFATVYAFTSKITTHWGKVRHVSYRLHSKKPYYCTRISQTRVVIDLCIKTWKILIFKYFHCNFRTTSTEIKLWIFPNLFLFLRVSLTLWLKDNAWRSRIWHFWLRIPYNEPQIALF